MKVVREGIANLHPAYFALVMATGIVSIAAHLLGMPVLASALFWLNGTFFVLLGLLYLARLLLATRRFAADLMDHSRGVGFFTVVAGTCVLGSQFVLIRGNPHVALALWYLGIGLWVVLIYAIFALLTVKQEKPSLAEGINGGWLVSVVATQSVSILGSLLVPQFPGREDLILFCTLVLWLGGGMLYIWIISLIFFRYTFFQLKPAQLAAPYWINMGAMAISTLAGATLMGNAARSALLAGLLPFLQGFTLFFWATATWWIPMLLILGGWRHLYMRYPLRYDPMYWGAVFPLGMYTACTYRVAKELDLSFLFVVPRYFIYVALGAWLLTFAGLVAEMGRFAANLASPEKDRDDKSAG